MCFIFLNKMNIAVNSTENKTDTKADTSEAVPDFGE